HYEAHNLRAIEACRNGELGILRTVASEHGFQAAKGTWRLNKKLAGGGALWDIGIYGVNAARYLTGQDPIEVTAFGNRLPGDARFDEVDDLTHMVLRFPKDPKNGSPLASISTGYSWRGANNYRVVGTSGTLLAEPATPYEGHRLTVNGKDPGVTPNDQFSAMLDHMAESVATGAKTTRTPGEMGLVDIRILQAALDSARDGRPKSLK
ncbi:Gfo/Idh/MocA family oxidoreductase, partial [bacterium]